MARRAWLIQKRVPPLGGWSDVDGTVRYTSGEIEELFIKHYNAHETYRIEPFTMGDGEEG